MAHQDYGDEDLQDPFTIDSVVCKMYDRKIFMHETFEEICSKYWQLLTTGKDASEKTYTINKTQYTKLMKRIYKVLLPLYREDEVSKEVAEEWIHDARGQTEMNMAMFIKTLHRIAHNWAVHIDLNEYIEILTRVYERITCKLITRKDGRQDVALPRIQVEIFQEKEEEDGAEWLSCLSDEYQKSDYEYKMVDDPNEEGVQKRYKRPIADGLGEDDGGVMMTVREPFSFKEEVQYFQPCSKETSEDNNRFAVEPPSNEETVTDILAEMHDIYPLGYPTEQFICKLKNDINTSVAKMKEDRKKAVAEMRRQMFEDGAKMKLEKPPDIQRDPGLIEGHGLPYEEFFSMHDVKHPSQNPSQRICTLLRVKDRAYNQMRTLFKDCHQMAIRPWFEHPTKAAQRAAPSSTKSDYFSFFNETGYNPSLERRLNYKQIAIDCDGSMKNHCLNVNYLLSDPVYETAYRSDVRRVETSVKMAIKPPGEGEAPQRHEFINVTTTFKETVQVMLSMKFQTFFTQKMSGKQDEAEKKRDDKFYEAEKERQTQVRLDDNLVAKGLHETYDEKNYLKLMKGPFYNFMSRDGIGEDLFEICGQQDVIDSANKAPQKILIIGKPRLGKTTLAKALAEKLDIVRVCPEVWLDNLFARIKDREENPHDSDIEEEEPEPVEEPPADDDPEEPKEGDDAAKAEGQDALVEEENQEPAEPVRAKKDRWLTDLEYDVRNKLRAGKCLDVADIDDILREQIASPLACLKGFVLDLDLMRNGGDQIWATRIMENIMEEDDSFTHVIELMADDEESKHRAVSIRVQPETGIAFSKWDRDERAKPKPKKDDEDEDPGDDDGDEEDFSKKPLVESMMVMRPCDSYDKVFREIEYYNMRERPSFDEFIVNLYMSTYIKLDIGGMTPGDLAETVILRLKPDEAAPLRPVAKQIEDAGSFKELLTAGIDADDDKFTLPRQFSVFRTTDPVALFNGQVEQGSAEFAAEYGNNVFCFQTEENMKAFLKEPCKYLSSSPIMPQTFRLMMLGPKGAGVHTQAERLEEMYGWKVVDFLQVVKNKLSQIMEMSVKPPNNVSDKGPCMICMSEQELNEIKEGKPVPSWKFIPWILEFLGCQLKVDENPPGEQESEYNSEWEEEKKKAYKKKQAKKAKEAEAAEKARKEAEAAKADRAARRQAALEAGQDLAELGLQESEEEIIIADVPLDWLVRAEDDDGTLPPINSFILLGFPQTEIHCQKLKEAGIEFDRVIFLTDKSEEEPGKGITERMNARQQTQYEYEAELEIANAVLGVVKEHMIGEEKLETVLKEVDCTGSEDEVFIKIRKELDPFFFQTDNPEDIKPSEEYEDEEKKRIQKGDFGDYCPVTFLESNFMVRGAEGQELFIYGKRYLFAGEEELEKFKFNPQKYTLAYNEIDLPLQPPPPKIMITGVKCSGVTSQINMLCAKYKLDNLELFNSYKQIDSDELKARQRSRLLARGFKGVPEPEDPEADREVDEEVINDPDDFEKPPQELIQIQKILKANQSLIIDGMWNDNTEEGGLETSEPIYTLLERARRMPEVIVILKCKDDISVAREIEQNKDALQQEFEDKMEAREKARDEARKAARQEKLEALQAEEPEEDTTPEQQKAKIEEEMAAWDAERDEQEKEEDENDEDKPDLEKMKEAIAEKIKELHARQTEFLDGMKEALAEKFIEVIELDTGKISADYVHIKLLDKLQSRFKYRKDLIEKDQVIALAPKEVPVYEASHTFKVSKFQDLSPISPYNPCKTKDFAALYRERIYFLSDEKEREEFMKQPSKFTGPECESFPLDLAFKPKIAVLGFPKSGKSDLCTSIASQTGAVHIRMETMIEEFCERDSSLAKKLREKLKSGRELDDVMLVNLLSKRVEYADCQRKGWVIENFPQTHTQAHLMVKKGLHPGNVFLVNIPVNEVYRRTATQCNTDFECNRVILARRLKYTQEHMRQVVFFFQKYYNSVTSINGLKSKWFVSDTAMRAIEANLTAKMNFARDFQHAEEKPRACIMQNMNLDRCYFKQTISQFGYFCPVSWLQEKRFITCAHIPEFTVLYKDHFYYFADATKRDIFVNNPKKFTEGIIFSQPRNIPMRFKQHKASEITESDKMLDGYCSVTLMDEEKLTMGHPLLLINYKDDKFCFASEEKLMKFFQSPSRYSKAMLPVKRPPDSKPVSLYNLQKEENSITFLEQALGSVVIKGLREIGETRLKYPTLSVKETMLKLFALFLKTENPANTEYMKQKYRKKMEIFLEKCTVPEELAELAKKKEKGKFPAFKERFYNQKGEQYDQILKQVEAEKDEGFASYMR